MDPFHAHKILPTNATSIANPLANTTPTAIAHDTVVEINREGELPEYREIKTTEKILQPIPLEYVPTFDTTPTETKIIKKTTTIEEVPKISIPNTITTTTVVEEIPTSTDYVIQSAGAFKPIPVNQSEPIVETIVTEPITKKIIKTIETTK